MLHYEFGKKARGLTFGIEASYWWEDPGDAVPTLGLPVGLDMGVEFTHTKVRWYSEAQTGFLVGASAGPFLEIPYASEAMAGGGSSPVFGFQGSIWGWFLAGADLRGRWNKDGAVFSPGLFAKAVGTSGGDSNF